MYLLFELFNICYTIFILFNSKIYLTFDHILI
jgi:hypothetical protein